MANTAIPEPFERIVLKALSKDPDDRYQSAEEMARMLHEGATEERPIRMDHMRPLIKAVGALLMVNTVAVTIAGVTRLWKIFDVGWPMELFLVAGVLTITLWMLAPIGVLAGNGLLFLYCTVTQNWDH